MPATQLPTNWYVTTYCNHAHNVKTGAPIRHECYTLPPKALEAEIAGDFDKANALLTEWVRNGRRVNLDTEIVANAETSEQRGHHGHVAGCMCSRCRSARLVEYANTQKANESSKNQVIPLYTKVPGCDDRDYQIVLARMSGTLQFRHLGKWEVTIAHDATRPDRGYFEHIGTGEGGGLWFEGRRLIDYDGVQILPLSVEVALADLGYVLDWTHFRRPTSE